MFQENDGVTTVANDAPLMPVRELTTRLDLVGEDLDALILEIAELRSKTNELLREYNRVVVAVESVRNG